MKIQFILQKVAVTSGRILHCVLEGIIIKAKMENPKQDVLHQYTSNLFSLVKYIKW